MFEESILEYLKNNLQVSSNLVSDVDMTWSLDQIVLTYRLKKKKIIHVWWGTSCSMQLLAMF